VQTHTVVKVKIINFENYSVLVFIKQARFILKILVMGNSLQVLFLNCMLGKEWYFKVTYIYEIAVSFFHDTSYHSEKHIGL
jgi:hypothetical protein